MLVRKHKSDMKRGDSTRLELGALDLRVSSRRVAAAAGVQGLARGRDGGRGRECWGRHHPASLPAAPWGVARLLIVTRQCTLIINSSSWRDDIIARRDDNATRR